MDKFLTDVLDCYNKSVPKKRRKDTIEGVLDEMEKIATDAEKISEKMRHPSKKVKEGE